MLRFSFGLGSLLRLRPFTRFATVSDSSSLDIVTALATTCLPDRVRYAVFFPALEDVLLVSGTSSLSELALSKDDSGEAFRLGLLRA